MERKNLLQRLGIFLLTVVLVLGAIAFTMNRDSLNFDAFRRWLLYGDLELSLYGESDSFSHGGGEYPSFALHDKGLVMVSRAGSRFYSFHGDVLAEKVVRYSNPVLHQGSDATVVYDAGGQGLSVYSSEREVFSLLLPADDAILSARFNENDWLCVVTQETGYKGVVTIYNKLFEAVMVIRLSTTFVSDAFLSPDNRSVVLVTVGQTQGIFESKLLFYDLNAQESKHTLTFSGKLVLDLDYESDVIWLLCEKEVILVSPSSYETVSWSFVGEYLKDATFQGDGFATLLLGQYRAGTASRLVTIDGEGQLLGEIAVESSPLSLSSGGQYVAYLTGEQFTLFQEDLSEYAVLEEVRHANEVAISKEGTVLLASQQEAWLYLPS